MKWHMQLLKGSVLTDPSLSKRVGESTVAVRWQNGADYRINSSGCTLVLFKKYIPTLFADTRLVLDVVSAQVVEFCSSSILWGANELHLSIRSIEVSVAGYHVQIFFCYSGGHFLYLCPDMNVSELFSYALPSADSERLKASIVIPVRTVHLTPFFSAQSLDTLSPFRRVWIVDLFQSVPGPSRFTTL